ncbi:MAG: alpha/beta hydrolase [Thermoguttaceae bacterium]|nr:alpha/beta hydrolase [Thermoguttaceae bacterium]
MTFFADISLNQRRTRLFLALAPLVFLAASLVGCDVMKSSGYSEDWREGVDGKTVESISYAEESWNKIDMFLPAELTPEKSRGAFFYIHGGSWKAGSRRDMRGFARRMTKAGYVSASMEYMLFNDKNRDAYSIFAVLDEIDAALATLKEEAAKRGIELDRVALGGDSAGGHIVSLYAYSRGKNAPIPVAFIAPRVAPIDFHPDAWTTLRPEAVDGLVYLLRGKRAFPKEETPDAGSEIESAIDAVSPLSYLNAETCVPTIAAYGGQDPLIGVNHLPKLAAKFAELGAKSIDDVDPADKDAVVFDPIEYPKSGHMLAMDPDCAGRFYELNLKYAERYLNCDESDSQNEK